MSTGVLGRVSPLPEGLSGYCSQSMYDRMASAQGYGEKWTALRDLVRRREVGIQVHCICLLWGTWLIILPLMERGSAGEVWGSRGTSEIEIAFGYYAALLHLQMDLAESGWVRIAGQEQSFISGARFRLREETWIIGLYGSHWLQRRNSPFSSAGH